jgi:16S rRNA processing protein RimM
VFLAVGRLRRPHGLRGEVQMDVLTDFPERLRRGKKVYLGEERRELVIRGVRGAAKTFLISFQGINSPEEAAELRGQLIFVSSKDLPRLEEGEYYHHELLGLTVVDEGGTVLGILEEILETGANDVYLVRTPDGSELLLPALKNVILAVNLDQGEMRVRPPEYL